MSKQTPASQNAVRELVPLLGDSSKIINSPYFDGSGGDIDCLVERVDLTWPLRAPEDWKFCQCFRYDITGWYWVLERDGEIVAVDSLDDSEGIGKYGFPTRGLAQGDGDLPAPAIAAYLTAKRIRKQMRDPNEWARIARLAGTDRREYLRWLGQVMGEGTAAAIAGEIAGGSAPTPRGWQRARLAQLRRRARTPGRVTKIVALTVERAIGRVSRPTGLTLLIVGPDGTGKSTLAGLLPNECDQLFRRYRHVHWRPKLLPRPGSLVSIEEGDPTEPHARPPRGRFVSAIFLFYYWMDFMLGEWVLLRPFRWRSGLVIWERGWWDFAVDPSRYRLTVSDKVVSAMGRLLPKPDLVLGLEAPGDVLAARKDELPAAELDRQVGRWRDMLPRRLSRVGLDVTDGIDVVVARSKRAVVDHLEARATRRLGAGWTNLPSSKSGRWVLPRGPRAVAAAGPKLYQPVTSRGLIGWNLARRFAAVGGFRFLPRGQAPPREVREVVTALIPPRGDIAMMRVRDSGRFVVLVMDALGRGTHLVKVATGEADGERIEQEAQRLSELGQRLQLPLRSPMLIGRGPGFMVVEAVDWRPRSKPWRLTDDVAYALGKFFNDGRPSDRGRVHGDFAPWNLLRTDKDWVLVDWEDADGGGRPLFDIFHFIVQGHALLGHPTESEIGNGLRGHGWIASTIASYVAGAGVTIDSIVGSFADYLDASERELDESKRDGRRGLRARRSLRERLKK